MAALTLKERGILSGYLTVLFGFLAIYFLDPSIKLFVDGWNEYLEGAIFDRPCAYFPPISILDFCGSLLVCKYYRLNVVGTKSWFEILFTCTLMQFGGTTIVSIVFLGHCPGWIIGQAAFPALLLTWWLTFYSPGDVYWKFIQNSNTIELIAGFFSAIASGHAIGSWGMDKAMHNKYHVHGESFGSSYLLCILAGSIAASGGGLLTQAFNLLGTNHSYTLRHTPPFFVAGQYNASATLNRSFLLSVLYYYLISDASTFLPSPKISLVTAHSLMSLIHLVIFFISVQLPTVDVFQVISGFLLKLLHIDPTLKLERKVVKQD